MKPVSVMFERPKLSGVPGVSDIENDAAWPAVAAQASKPAIYRLFNFIDCSCHKIEQYCSGWTAPRSVLNRGGGWPTAGKWQSEVASLPSQ
ncbi:hypothetical protein [Azohydromonas caseinilytica]|uniref:hypothetical protein n=1 Tax=Azohydromonas caseinilytica TaxID=2728836 RepID=UPI001F2006BB|nr:hypothetical protein [Azohydromonas caseinilytica]